MLYNDRGDPDIQSNGLRLYDHPKFKGCAWVSGILDPPYSGLCGWKLYADDDIELHFNFIFEELWNWVYDYAGEPLEVVEPRLSAADKQLIVDSLGSYCRPKYRDWDSLVDALSPLCRQRLPTILAECLLNKAMFDNFVKHPFFYLMEPGYEGFEVDGVPTAFGEELLSFWKRLTKGMWFELVRSFFLLFLLFLLFLNFILSNSSASTETNKPQITHHMRTLTTRLLNGFDVWDENEDDSIGIQSRMLRKSAAKHVAASLLDKSSALSLLIRPYEREDEVANTTSQHEKKSKKNKKKKTEKQHQQPPPGIPHDGRFERLVTLFREAGERATCLFTQQHFYYCIEDCVEDLGPFDGPVTGREDPGKATDQGNVKMMAHTYSREDYPDGVLNGRWPVLMVRPMIAAAETNEYRHYQLQEMVTQNLCRSIVVLDKHEPISFK
ncbi:uncharacterized protein LDX57_009354 [Aspergillus melleus]|uniref:uncharacterized protein n=1 Tax=Aspergillus melleus TaxID=138277 RepID=UPI001E8CFD0B|nr:uncharacterized protein LDX57_009354 [Aspergillus melleus]KAH8431699.1 hypothetical protein LDX57_009354 [Aspergillus melleus]